MQSPHSLLARIRIDLSPEAGRQQHNAARRGACPREEPRRPGGRGGLARNFIHL